MAMLVQSPKTCTDDLARVMQASQIAHAVRACLLLTRDRDYALTVLKETVVACGRPLYHFTVADRRRYQAETLKWETVGAGLADTTELLRSAGELRGGGVVVFEDCVAALRDEGGDPRMRMTLAQLLSAETMNEGLVLIFVEPPEAETRLPSILADQFVRLTVPYPRAEELERIAREELALAAHRAHVLLAVEAIRSEAPRLASGMVGLTRSAARDALRDALAPDPRDIEAAFERLQRRKALQLSRELAMNLLDTSAIDTPIGLDYLVAYLRIRRDSMRLTGPERAKGVLLIGPAGTGKTLLARAIGRLVELPVVEFRISALMNSLLGETERRFAQAFATLEAMAPNVVFIDEIEKAFGDSSERDGGTMMRCTGALLSWLSDNPYPNFIVATSNNLKRMGEIGLTMTRSERFDACFFVDVPNLASRCAMLERWLSGLLEHPDVVAQELAECTEKFSGADLRSVVKHATTQAEYAHIPVHSDLLKAEIERKRMRAIALYDEFQELRRWGQIHCDPAGPMEHY
jgi:hypothetical protein